MTKKVFVSGCFDLLHSGHIAFFEEAASYGDLYVALGADRTVAQLKGRPPVNSEEERLYMIRSVAVVHQAFVSRGSGYLDFSIELAEIRPDYFVVNEDGNTPAKAALCRELGIEYVVLERKPHSGLTERSTTALRAVELMPYRIDLAGGWLDQPFVSRVYPGAVITLSIEPTIDFNERSGMASSTRRAALELWGSRLPAGDPHKLAKLLFCFDNPPGTREISGAQDSIGIVYAGLARSHYSGEYWPHQIDQLTCEPALRFVESCLYLIPLGPRTEEYDVLGRTVINTANARALADATEQCWQAILAEEITAFGQAVRASFEAQIAMFPEMVTPTILSLIEQYQSQALGWKISGAGGGGYLILVSKTPIEHALRPMARRYLE